MGKDGYWRLGLVVILSPAILLGLDRVWNGGRTGVWDRAHANWLTEDHASSAWRNGADAVFPQGGPRDPGGRGNGERIQVNLRTLLADNPGHVVLTDEGGRAGPRGLRLLLRQGARSAPRGRASPFFQLSCFA